MSCAAIRVYRAKYKLTDREIDAAVLLLAGYNAADIAKILTISVNTVKTHLKISMQRWMFTIVANSLSC